MKQVIKKAASHYSDKYFKFQQPIGEIGGRINAPLFAKYISNKDTVLDFGCGGGYLLSNLDCHQRIGVEINPYARKISRQQGISVFSSLSAIKPSSIDKVISNHALEHVENPMDVINLLYQVLKPKGMLILVLPFDDYRTFPYY